MNAWMAGLLAVPAFAALSQAMERHHSQPGAALPASAAWGWRALGTALLLAALWVCLQRWGTSVAVAAWLGVLTPAALAVALVLTYAPRQVRVLAACSAASAVGLGVRIFA